MNGSRGGHDPDSSAREVLRCYGVSCPQPTIEPLGNHGGFSGARLWRITSLAGHFCLRGWPPDDPSPDRLQEIHESMIVARRFGLTFVPAILATDSGSTFAQCADRLWELTSWMPGRADFHAQPTPARLEAACTALARVHQVWCRSARSVGTCTGVLRRAERAHEWLRLIRQGWLPSFTPADPFSPWTRRAWSLLRQHVSRIPEQLAMWVGEELPLQRCLCDIWHDHVLFEQDAVTGLIDFGALKTDHAAVDLARLLGS